MNAAASKVRTFSVHSLSMGGRHMRKSPTWGGKLNGNASPADVPRSASRWSPCGKTAAGKSLAHSYTYRRCIGNSPADRRKACTAAPTTTGSKGNPRNRKNSRRNSHRLMLGSRRSAPKLPQPQLRALAFVSPCRRSRLGANLRSEWCQGLWDQGNCWLLDRATAFPLRYLLNWLWASLLNGGHDPALVDSMPKKTEF